MKRIVVELRDGFVNIPGDRLERDVNNNMIFAYNGKELAGAFDIDAVMKIYISEKRSNDEL